MVNSSRDSMKIHQVSSDECGVLRMVPKKDKFGDENDKGYGKGRNEPQQKSLGQFLRWYDGSCLGQC